MSFPDYGRCQSHYGVVRCIRELGHYPDYHQGKSVPDENNHVRRIMWHENRMPTAAEREQYLNKLLTEAWHRL